MAAGGVDIHGLRLRRHMRGVDGACGDDGGVPRNAGHWTQRGKEIRADRGPHVGWEGGGTTHRGWTRQSPVGAHFRCNCRQRCREGLHGRGDVDASLDLFAPTRNSIIICKRILRKKSQVIVFRTICRPNPCVLPVAMVPWLARLMAWQNL